MTPCKVICQKVRPTGVSKESLLGHHITPKRKSPKGVLTLFTGTCQKVRPTGVSKKLFLGIRTPKYGVHVRQETAFMDTILQCYDAPKGSCFDTPVGRTFWQSHPTPHLVSFFLSVYLTELFNSDYSAVTTRRYRIKLKLAGTTKAKKSTFKGMQLHNI